MKRFDKNSKCNEINCNIISSERFVIQFFEALKSLDQAGFSWLPFYSTWPWLLRHRQYNFRLIVASPY